MERYNPASRRRRNSSSVSAPNEKRQKITDQDEGSMRRSKSPAERSTPEAREEDVADEVGH